MPSKSIIIFCTTEGDKILPEIKNRCFSLRFNGLNPEIIGKRIAEVLNESDHEPFTLLAKEAHGSFRQAWAFIEVWQESHTKLTKENVYLIVGAVPRAERNKLWKALKLNNLKLAQTIWKTWVGKGANPSKIGGHLLEDLIDMAAIAPNKAYWQKPLAVLSGARLINSYDAWLPAIISIAGLDYPIKEELDLNNLGAYLYK
jgi:DNA polymerase III gamma/tau subunit